MNLVLDQLKGILSESVAKFLKENIKLEDTDIKTIFGDNMDKVLYHDEGFLKDLSSKMSDVVMPAYMKELRYLKKVVSGVDDVTKTMKGIQDKFAQELRLIKPNPQNANETIVQMNKVVEEFIKKATEITQNKIGLREVNQDDIKEQDEEKAVEEAAKEEAAKEEAAKEEAAISPLSNNLVSPMANVALRTPASITNTMINEIENIVKQASAKKGGAPKHLPNVEHEVNKYMLTHEKTLKIPKRNYNDYNGNISQLLNQIIREKMVDFETNEKISDAILNSKSYKDVIDSLNGLFIVKPDIRTEAINNLINTIKTSKMTDSEMQKILDKITSQIKSLPNKGGTRKRK